MFIEAFYAFNIIGTVIDGTSHRPNGQLNQSGILLKNLETKFLFLGFGQKIFDSFNAEWRYQTSKHNLVCQP